MALEAAESDRNMIDDFPVILGELDNLCASSKYACLFSDSKPFVDLIRSSFGAFQTQKQQSSKSSKIGVGAPREILQKLLVPL